MITRIDPSENHCFNYLPLLTCPTLPLLFEDGDGDVGEHEGVNHEHDQDRTCKTGHRTFTYHISKITKEPHELVPLTVEEKSITKVHV